jgi:hypothetical protein
MLIDRFFGPSFELSFFFHFIFNLQVNPPATTDFEESNSLAASEKSDQSIASGKSGKGAAQNDVHPVDGEAEPQTNDHLVDGKPSSYLAENLTDEMNLASDEESSGNDDPDDESWGPTKRRRTDSSELRKKKKNRRPN